MILGRLKLLNNMKKMHIFSGFIALLGLSCLTSCHNKNSNQTVYPTTEPATRLVIGSSGGFAGTSTHYELMPDGRVFQYDMKQQSHTYLFDIPEQKAEQIYKSFELLSPQLPKMEETFNFQHEIYYYQAGAKQRWIWDPSLQDNVPTVLTNTYYIIRENLKKNK